MVLAFCFRLYPPISEALSSPMLLNPRGAQVMHLVGWEVLQERVGRSKGQWSRVLPTAQHRSPRGLERHWAIPGHSYLSCLPPAQRVWQEGPDANEREARHLGPHPRPPGPGVVPARAGALQSPPRCSCAATFCFSLLSFMKPSLSATLHTEQA